MSLFPKHVDQDLTSPNPEQQTARWAMGNATRNCEPEDVTELFFKEDELMKVLLLLLGIVKCPE